MAIKIEPEFLGNHYGQSDWVLRAVDDDVVMGSLWFTEYEDKISVKMLESNPQYKKTQKGLGSGIGRVLVRKLQELYPGTEIHPGMMTDEGSRLLKALPRRYEPSSLYERLQAKLDEKKAEEVKLEKMFEGWYDLPEQERELSRENVLQHSDQLNRLHDQVYKLETMLRGKSKGKWIVTRRFVRPMKLTTDFSLVK